MAAGGKYQNVYGGGNVSRMDWWAFSPEGEARLYDAATGRFTRPDPLSEKKTMLSHYLYCGANPLTRIDPSGLDDYIFDRKGYLLERTENPDRDYIAVRGKDDGDNLASMELPYGSFEFNNGTIHEKKMRKRGKQ